MPDDGKQQASAEFATVQTTPFDGFVETSAQPGEQVVLRRIALIDSDEPQFHLLLAQIEQKFLAPLSIQGESITHFFIAQAPDGSARVYLSYSHSFNAVALNDIRAGEPVTETDIDLGSITTCKPLGISFRPDETLVCVLKIGWKYGLLLEATRSNQEDRVYTMLGTLYREMRLNQTFSRLQERFNSSQQVFIVAEGKTDWRHIESARRYLGIRLNLAYAETDETLGSRGLLQLCEHFSQFGPDNDSTIIAIFDHDEPDVIKKLERKKQGDGYQIWGNKVYSLAIPVPDHRRNYSGVCIEMLYFDNDISKLNREGKRLYFDNEVERVVIEDGEEEWVTHAPDQKRELMKKPFGRLASKIRDEAGVYRGISKARFAEHMYSDNADYSDFNRSGFLDLFAIIKRVISDRTGTSRNPGVGTK